MPEELTVREAAARHGVTASWLIRNLDQIQHRQIGPLYLLEAESVAAWAAQRKRRGGSAKGVPWSKKKRHEPSSHQPSEQPTPAALRVLPTPPRPGATGGQSVPPTPARPPLPEPQAIDLETPAGVHLKIDALHPEWQTWMYAEATQGEVIAWIDIRPYPDARWPGGYTLDSYYDRRDRDKKGNMGRHQEEQAQALLRLLRERVTEALHAAGWQTCAQTPAGATLWQYRPSH